MGARVIFFQGQIQGCEKVATFLDVFALTTNAQNTLQHFQRRGQVP